MVFVSYEIPLVQLFVMSKIIFYGIQVRFNGVLGKIFLF